MRASVAHVVVGHVAVVQQRHRPILRGHVDGRAGLAATLPVLPRGRLRLLGLRLGRRAPREHAPPHRAARELAARQAARARRFRHELHTPEPPVGRGRETRLTK